MKTLMLYLSVTLFASLGPANAQSNEPQPAGQTIDGGPPKSQPGTNLGNFPTMDHDTYTKMMAAKGVPREALYYFFFTRLLAQDDAAVRQEAKGKGFGSYRTVYSREAGLTDDEGAIMNQVALDWKRQEDDIESRRQAVVDAQRAEPNPPRNLITGAEFSQFGKEQNDNTDEHIDELKSQLGEASFAKLDAYVKVLIHPSVAQPGHLPKRPAAPPAGS
jgi:hypothetical protein